MTVQTPWRPYRTLEPESINCWSSGGWISIQTGTGAEAVICRLNSTDRQLRLIPRVGANAISVDPYRIQLSHWTRQDIPVIHMHPFGLLHLIVSGQYSPVLLVAAAAGIGRTGRDRVFVPLERSSDILTMLGVTRGAMLSLSTHNDLEVNNRA